MDYHKISKDTMGYLYAGYKSLSNSPLAADLRALIELRVSQVNGCTYCCNLHKNEALELKVDNNKIESLANFNSSDLFSDGEKEALKWAEQLTKLEHQAKVNETNLAAYYNEREIVDITICIAMMNMFNRIAMSMKHEP